MRFVIMLLVGLFLAPNVAFAVQRTHSSQQKSLAVRTFNEKSVLAPDGRRISNARIQKESKEDEVAVSRQIRALQQQLAREEKSLHRRLVELNRMRQSALAKQDHGMLKKIEQLEKQAIQRHQRMVDHMVSRATQQVTSGAKTRRTNSPAPRSRTISPPKRRPRFFSY